MPAKDGIHARLLQRYPRAIVHMRRQLEGGRFGLIFGAGLGRHAGIPTWRSLVESIAGDSRVDGAGVLKAAPPRAGQPYQTEMLYAHFRSRRYEQEPAAAHNTRLLDTQIGAEWRGIIRTHLYSGVDGDLANAIESHPYLRQFLPIVRRTYMTVTYNFDDLLEQSLLRDRHDGVADTRGFEAITNPWMQFRRSDAIIYHPNGVIPQNPLESPSDRFIFSEASYVKQLMGIFAGDQAGLVSHLARHTCLLVGLSLEDDTLRNALTQVGHSCPGNYHYYVRYMKDGENLDPRIESAIALANFKVYNLITLFLNDADIRALAELIDPKVRSQQEFCDFAREQGVDVRYRFYVTGALGVGKSTVINHLRNLVVLDEWLDPRPPVLAKSWDLLEEHERVEADSWIAGQFKRKNDRLRNEPEGIFVMDRGPLDPVCFTPDQEWKAKAGRLMEAICPGKAMWEVEDGKVVLLEGDPEELALRLVLTNRTDYTAAKLEAMEQRLSRAYGSKGVIRINTRGLTPSDIARRLAEIVHFEDYHPVCNLHERLSEIRDGV